MPNLTIEIKAIPNSPLFRIEKKNNQVIIHCKSPPEQNKANLEIVKELGRLTGSRVKIVKGLRSKRKTIVIDDISEEEFLKKL
ncbi:MAG: DUF167 domain-containing protein [Candidatus Aenigmarchaeota archaeon]|nr:DUF167 domain-containing protein [Candidatus Aenigmarchaeota archaeon]NCO96981.1 DUF167 domain-containing protein [Candidatus Aenigmarchaeota archaeon]NCS70738.1 DUF167 domain-containing protein [Candidatus Aenigmarchaeota archaeon]